MLPYFIAYYIKNIRSPSTTLPTHLLWYLNLFAETAAGTWFAAREVFVLQFFPQILLPAPCPTNGRMALTEATFRPSHATDLPVGKSPRSKALLSIISPATRVCFVIQRFSLPESHSFELYCSFPKASTRRLPKAHLFSTAKSAQWNPIQSLISTNNALSTVSGLSRSMDMLVDKLTIYRRSNMSAQPSSERS
jgi:hypothetical protein